MTYRPTCYPFQHLGTLEIPAAAAKLARTSVNAAMDFMQQTKALTMSIHREELVHLTLLTLLYLNYNILYSYFLDFDSIYQEEQEEKINRLDTVIFQQHF